MNTKHHDRHGYNKWIAAQIAEEREAQRATERQSKEGK